MEAPVQPGWQEMAQQDDPGDQRPTLQFLGPMDGLMMAVMGNLCFCDID